ncbi:MAG: M6 family metalloprotease domain-containing protein [Gemmatimonadetes bacterium]|nr:M6 family metalloprotease domain-containing protein [Gemmatimonadota bacterium]
MRPPASIAGLTDAQPYAPMEFSRAWLGKVEQVRRRRQELLAAGRLDGLDPQSAAKLGAALTGTLRVLVIPVLYADGTPPFSSKELSDRLFGPARGDTVSYASYYDEVSGGLLKVTGAVTSWLRLSHPASHYLPKEAYGWGGFGRVKELREEALELAEPYIDFGQFDNDGPDGVPNSGDDDGFVDFVVFLYATPCKGDSRPGAIWPHRGAMEPFATRSPSKSGGTIRIADYLVLSAVDPETCGPLHVGVLAHETGHVLGLPDLYDYDGSSQGIGAWGLMGTGSHSMRYSPTHLGAWAKEQLGWVTVRWLKKDTTALSLPPVETSHTIYRYDLAGTGGEYLLFENRQKLGSDRYIPGSGMVAWRVDPERGELGAWNSDERKPAVAVLRADLGSDAPRGDAEGGDPAPRAEDRHTFEYAQPAGLRLNRIAERDGVVSMDVSLAGAPAVASRRGVVRLSAVQGAKPVGGVVRLPADSVPAAWTAEGRAAWLSATRSGNELVLRADPASLPPGAYADTISVRAVGDTAGAARKVVVALEVTAPGSAEVLATQLPWSWGLAVQGDRILQAGYGWDPLGLRPRPRVLAMGRDDPLPRTLVRIPSDAVYSPVVAPNGAAYVVARAAGDDYLYSVDETGTAHVVARLGDTAPAYGTAVLADGDILVADWSGRIYRVTPDGRVSLWCTVDEHLYQIAASRSGDVAAAGYEGDVLHLSPDGTLRRFFTGFGRGRLVAVASTPEGDVFAAERGGRGRIVRFSADGRKLWEAAIPGAQFYGLTVSGSFLYALDLGHRHLLRLPLPQATAPARAAIAAQQR